MYLTLINMLMKIIKSLKSLEKFKNNIIILKYHNMNN